MQTIGQKLKQAREEKRLTLEKVFEAVRIRIPYLMALEADDLSAMPSPVQARGYLRNYAEFLGLNFDQLLEEMRIQGKPSDEIIVPNDTTAKEEILVPEPPLDIEVALPPKPKPARRKKADAPPESEPIITPKKRGRKKVEPEPEPVLDVQPGEEMVPILAVGPASVVEETVEPGTVVPEQRQDLQEGLWQTWLNRLNSMASVRVKRGPKSPPGIEISRDEPESNSQDSLQPDSAEPSGEIFKEIGGELRKRREMLSLHFDEVERSTHVKAHYLEALENGAMDDLPSTVQTRGMVSNYASFLDLDVDAILLRYADALQARHREKNPKLPGRKPGQPIIANIPPLRSFIAGDMIFGVGMVILLVGFSIWGVTRVVTLRNEQNAGPTAPSISDVLLATTDPSLITPTTTLAPVEFNEPTVTIVIPTQNLNVSVQVNLIAVERTYLRVIVDGEQVFNGRVVPGNAYPFEAEQQVEVLVGSGAAIRIVYNGRDLGLMGAFGQVVSNIYREEEIITPTALPTGIPTITFTPTVTAPASATPALSATPATTLTP
jgi:cytoskeletal protein RodZ